MQRPLIVVTNDDGIDSDGLWAAVAALVPLGQVLVVAPDRQWSGAGRSMPHDVTGALTQTLRHVDGQAVPAYAIDATPALCVVHAMIEFVPRKPDLVVSGINFGENISTEVTISGTIGAALEAAAFGVPGMAVSLEMSLENHLADSTGTDYGAGQAFTTYFANRILNAQLPPDVDVLNINIPIQATHNTPWRVTRLSRHRYFVPVEPDRKHGCGRPGYAVMGDLEQVERDSDIWALRVARTVSVTPLSMDITSRCDFGSVEHKLRTAWRDGAAS